MKISVPGIKTFILGRYGGLLTVLILVMLMSPFVATTFGKYLLEALFIAALLTGLRAIEMKRGLFRFELLLLVAGLSLTALGPILNQQNLFFSGVACRLVFLLLVALAILVHLFHSQKVTSDTLAGAVCVYLLIALIWSYAFLLCEFWEPQSFSFTQGHSRLHLWLSKDFSDFFYFSMVTMTTVGYGDAAPVSSLAKNLAVMEALTGQVYLTILVARLVGMQLMSVRDTEN